MNLIVRGEQFGRQLRIPVRRGVGLDWLLDGEAWADPIYTALLPAVDGVFVDVGVNLGQSLVRVRLLEENRAYLGFEPNPHCIAYTERLLRLNDLGPARIIPAALADSDGEADLLFTREDPADPSATIIAGYKGPAAIRSRRRVSMRSFQSVETEQPIGRIGILKIDVEGAECEVLRSMRERLAKDRPVVLIEILPTGVPPLPIRLQRQREIEALFVELDYHLHRVRNKPGDQRLEAMHGPIAVHNDQDLANFIVLPIEREEQLLPLLYEAMSQQ
ncbi:MAG: FkbM family methyltransferase [Flavobacteriales bacterium]|nr:FkbM family methyltransferase [Flavobacteriales bacterium]